MAGPTSMTVMRNHALRNLMAVWTAVSLGSSAHAVLVVVLFFSVGGATAVAAALLVRVLPSWLLGPVVAGLAARPRPRTHLATGICVRALTMAATIAAVLTSVPLVALLALVAVDSLVSAVVRRPLHDALVLRLADTPADAAAASALTGVLVNACALAGPLQAGLAIRLLGIEWAFGLPAVAFAAAAGLALLIRLPNTDDTPPNVGSSPFVDAFRAKRSAVAAGFRAIYASRPAHAAAALLMVNATFTGVWYVASAAVAADHLGLGKSGITTIMAVYAAGGLLGAMGAQALAVRRGLTHALAAAMIVWAGTLAVIGVVVEPAVGLALAAGAGMAAATASAIAPTLVQRSVAPQWMALASGSLHSLSPVCNAAGAGISAALISAAGVPVTMTIATGSLLATTALAWSPLRKAEALSADDAAKLGVIRASPIMAPLPAPALEHLARSATRLVVPAGAEVIRQGDPGDRFYLIADGVADVTVDARRVATLGAGGSFGEIALLHGLPRTATVTAHHELDLVAVGRAEFLRALSSDIGVVGDLGEVAHSRLDTSPVGERMVELDRDSALGGRSIVELLGSQGPLADVDAGALSTLAEAARVVSAPDGALITREGDYGCTYYVIVAGGAAVLEGGRTVRTLGRGDAFGEQAIVRDVPRTASVRAQGDTTLVAVGREDFQRARTQQ